MIGYSILLVALENVSPPPPSLKLISYSMVHLSKYSDNMVHYDGSQPCLLCFCRKKGNQLLNSLAE